MNNSKSNDIYGISVKLIKIVSPFVSKILTNIFNETFLQGIFPDKLKYARVTPIHKGGSKLLLNNYRPISILPLFSKILEQLMQKRIIKYLHNNNQTVN